MKEIQATLTTSQTLKSRKASGTLYVEDNFTAVVCEVGVVFGFLIIAVLMYIINITCQKLTNPMLMAPSH